MVQPSGVHKHTQAIAIYMPMVREVCDLTPIQEKEIKKRK